jgi:hypothetical protein
MTHRSTPARDVGAFANTHVGAARQALKDFACRSILLLVELMTWPVGRSS